MSSCTITNCPSGKGDGHEMSQLDTLFGCDRSRAPTIVRNGRGMRRDKHDYREDLARFPNDPEAYTDGPTAVKKLWDRRQRQGWRRRELKEKPKPKTSLEMATEAYERAKATGFRTEQERSNDG